MDWQEATRPPFVSDNTIRTWKSDCAYIQSEDVPGQGDDAHHKQDFHMELTSTAPSTKLLLADNLDRQPEHATFGAVPFSASRHVRLRASPQYRQGLDKELTDDAHHHHHHHHQPRLPRAGAEDRTVTAALVGGTTTHPPAMAWPGLALKDGKRA
ncbi:hypothetical protein JDV02_002485 [Purpureocillium takamizusanense]|uniref:Uncharacterized protein n=1 Tax=Purpureocillium takamizusanense TaxID=2060973 RepID=A0A9Q8V8P6_9HYPO|nr:uncharacterized protein JDV02_002485 [Purpureocillium takamizusanense]UNI16007.1 hypothetical protein JDV02_002485 [Purpureocillium takamizusanense]